MTLVASYCRTRLHPHLLTCVSLPGELRSIGSVMIHADADGNKSIINAGAAMAGRVWESFGIKWHLTLALHHPLCFSGRLSVCLSAVHSTAR